MGSYNSHAPLIIGNEWVPIRQADYHPDDVTEQGYTFHIDHSVVPITGAYYVAEVPQTKVNNVCDTIAVYPAGQEKLTGPIKQVFIPASAIWVTGASISSSAGVAALQNPSDDRSIRFTGPSDLNTFLGISFDVTSYSQQLFGKRILDVSFRYSIAGHDVNDLNDIVTRVGYAKDMNGFGFLVMFQKLEGSVATGNEPTQVSSFSLGTTNYLWDATRDPYTVHDVYPWRYQELARFAATEPAATRMLLRFANEIAASNNAFIYFVDMQVTYCDETRVLYGGRSTTSFQDPIGSVTQSNYELGPNLVRLFNTSFVSNSTILTPGDYAVTLTHDDWPIDLVGAPKVRALRELYPMPAQVGLRVNKSLLVDDTFTTDEIPVITEITLHTSAAVVTGVHPYGVQDDVPVYGTTTAIQEIEDDPVGAAKSFPQVRFYARRFGQTSVPLTLVDVATELSTVSITVEDFDVLPEIADGWREVNLTFTTPPSFATAAGDVDWRWQAPSELSRNQWQILGAGSNAFAAHSIGPASYYAPQGNTVTLTWQSPTISGTADDTLSDAVLIFSQDPPAVTGFAITTLTQVVTGIPSRCDLPDGCVPSDIFYNQLSWPYPAGSAYFATDFNYVATDGWGASWTDGGNPTNFAVNGTYATITPNGTSARLITTPLGRNFDVSADLGVANSVVATTTAHNGIIGRHTDISNYYYAEVRTAPTTGILTLVLIARVAGSNTTLATVVLPDDLTNNAGAWVRMRFMGQDDRLKVKVWHRNLDEPEYWSIEITNTALTTGNNVGIFAQSETLVGNTLTIDNFEATPPRFWFGGYEVQRSDALTDWQTIMYATSPAVTGFADYEARVGVESQYRIRQCNVLDFCGSVWVTGAATLPDPGVTINGSGSSLLIFTSNEDPNANLAYVMNWEGQPIETFVFPEADEVQLQRMYGKDFFTAFHPLERGGDQFTRTILVNAAAIALPSLANFTGLRDLAWASLNYVCVRDELGNRWYANIIVPTGSVRLDRTIYLAQIQVSEVTATPTPVDPEVT